MSKRYKVRERHPDETPSEYLAHLRFECDMKLATVCYKYEQIAILKGCEHKCTCPDVANWDYDKCMKYLTEGVY